MSYNIYQIAVARESDVHGRYIYSNTSNQTKMDDLSRIVGALNINMVIAER